MAAALTDRHETRCVRSESQCRLADRLGRFARNAEVQREWLLAEANDIIVDAMGWRTLQVPRASALTEQLTVPKLLDCIRRKDTSAVQALLTGEGVNIFTKADATALVERLSP